MQRQPDPADTGGLTATVARFRSISRSTYLVTGVGLLALSLALVGIAQLRKSEDPPPVVGIENPGGAAAAADTTRVATGLHNPRGVAVLPDGRLVVVEAGNGIETSDRALETGRVSVFDDLNDDGDYDDPGEIDPIISQIPSYNTLTQFGTGHDEVGGAGDIVWLDDGRLFLTRDDPSQGYVADGSTSGINVVELDIESGLGRNLIVRNATMNALAWDRAAEILYVVESGANRLIAVTTDGASRIVAEFADLERGQQAVPAGVAIDPTTGDLLVALFSGQIGDYFGSVLSFWPGDAKVVRVDPATGRQTDAITGLTTAVDVAVDGAGNVFVVELTSTWPSARMPRDFDLFDPDAAPDPGGYARSSGSVTLYPADDGPVNSTASRSTRRCHDPQRRREIMVRMITHDDVRRIASTFPETVEKPSYGGRPSWRTPKQMFIWIRDAPEALVVWVESEEDKLAMISSEPDTFFTTDHYDGHPIVLVRLEAVDVDEATELITESWRLRAPKKVVAEWDAANS